jgi:DNA-binding response OmpR family regulator
MSRRILVVHADSLVRRALERTLVDAGFAVTPVATFEEARDILESDPPDLLVADVRLGEYNGLHLALRRRSDVPTPTIITHVMPDVVFERAAADAGATFLSDPLNNPQFLPSVRRALGVTGGPFPVLRRWTRKRAAQPIPVRVGDTDVSIVDVSYGGLQLAVDGTAALPRNFELRLPDSGVTVPVKWVWSSSQGAGGEVADDVPEWRSFVDSIESIGRGAGGA